ncbi:MAG: hypothetical protein IJR72_05805 [Oscillospiraceae bacterium]|nr:hypothetical protein [Oscillospiraceae bacterium]
MAEFDDKLNQILSNPDAMAQIARLAQSLNASGNPVSSADTPPGNVSSSALSGSVPSGVPPGTLSNGAPPGTLSNGVPPGTLSNDAPPGNASDPAPPGTMSGSAPDGKVSNAAPPDAGSVAQFLPLLQELGGDSDARRLLYALRPYLRPRKQEKVERALRFARLFRVGKRFLSQWEG